MPLTVPTDTKYQYHHQTRETELRSHTEINQGGRVWSLEVVPSILKPSACLSLMQDTNASAANYFKPHAQPALGIEIMQGPFPPGQASNRHAPTEEQVTKIQVF